MLTAVELSNLLRRKGYKVTPQRLAIYAALASVKTHPTAETLYKMLQPSNPAMSLATVYKTMDIFHKINAVRVLSTGEDSFRYDADMSEHYHLQCDVCGAVNDVELMSTQQITSEVEQKSGYRIHRREFYFFGVCPKCRKE